MVERIAFTLSPRCGLSFSEWAWVWESATPIKMQRAPLRRSAKGCTKPIVPPVPIMAASLPKPALSAPRAASKAGPSGSVVHQGMVPVTVAVTFTP
jgi:hypothetical protein